MHLKVFAILISQFVVVLTLNLTDNLDRYIIACHTTDFVCFKRQYIALRDHVLLGNDELAIRNYEPFQYKYGESGTCVKLSGIEESELVAINMDNRNNEYTMVIEMPLRIHQVRNSTKPCANPDKAFERVGTHTGPLRRFTGNATVQVTYPYTLSKIDGEVFINMSSENLDVILDIPDLSHFNKHNRVESRLYEWSEWAYHVVQHTDIARQVVMPFTKNFRVLMDKLPLHRILLLYPEEDYSTLQLMYTGNTISD